MTIFKSKSTQKMLRTIIIDDEIPMQQGLEKMLKSNCPNVKVVATAGSVEEGLKAISLHHPDLVFLDIKMNDGTGFDLLKQVDSVDFKVIFITAFNQYAVKAFKFSALDYLLKPVDTDELAEAVKKAEKVIISDMLTQLNILEEQLRNENTQNRKIILKTHDSIYILQLHDLVYFESDGNYTTVYLVDGKRIIVSKSLREFEEMLTNNGFYRVHKSFLVNLSLINRFDKGDGGFLVMNTGDRVPVATRKKEKLLDLFDELINH
jgi:two-component system, LytTR family, response regulator